MIVLCMPVVLPPLHILLRCITVVVGAERLTGCASVVVADIASAGVAILVVRKIPYGVFCVFPVTLLPPKLVSECDNIPGMTCPDLTALVSSGRSNSRMRVKVSFESSGIETMKRFVATGNPVDDAYVTRKWSVAPESNIAQSLMS